MPITQEYVRELIDSALAFQRHTEALLGYVDKLTMEHERFNSPLEPLMLIRSMALESRVNAKHIAKLAAADHQYSAKVMRKNTVDKIKHRRHRWQKLTFEADVTRAQQELSQSPQPPSQPPSLEKPNVIYPQAFLDTQPPNATAAELATAWTAFRVRVEAKHEPKPQSQTPVYDSDTKLTF